MAVEANAPPGGPTPAPGTVRIANRGGLADLVADAELEKAAGGVLSPGQAPPPVSGKMLRVEVRGLLHDWFDVADMGDFIRSPQFAGTLRENVARYFGVPIERQAIYDEDGLLTSCADYSRALQRFYPKLFIYDLEEMGPDLRARAVEELRQLDADVEQSYRQFGAGRDSRGISPCPSVSQEKSEAHGGTPAFAPGPSGPSGPSPCEACEARAVGSAGTAGTGTVGTVELDRFDRFDRLDACRGGVQGVQGGVQGVMAQEPFVERSTLPVRSDAPTVSPRTVASQVRPLTRNSMEVLHRRENMALTPRSAVDVTPQSLTPREMAPQVLTPRSAVEVVPQTFIPRELPQALTPRSMLEITPQPLTPRMFSSNSQPRLIDAGNISPRFTQRMPINVQPTRLEPGNPRIVGTVGPRASAASMHQAWLVSPSSPGQVTPVPPQHVAPAASPVVSVRSQTPPPCAPCAACAAYAPCQVPLPCQAHGCGACGRIRRVSNPSTTGACPACPACPAGPSGPSGPGVVSSVSAVSSGSMPRLQLGLGGLPPPPGISLSLKPDLPQLKQLGNPIPPVSPRVLQFPN